MMWVFILVVKVVVLDELIKCLSFDLLVCLYMWFKIVCSVIDWKMVGEL